MVIVVIIIVVIVVVILIVVVIKMIHHHKNVHNGFWQVLMTVETLVNTSKECDNVYVGTIIG